MLMHKFPVVHECFKHPSSTEYRVGDAKKTIGLTHLDDLFLLSCDEFFCRTTIRAANMNTLKEDSYCPFNAKRFYEEFC